MVQRVPRAAESEATKLIQPNGTDGGQASSAVCGRLRMIAVLTFRSQSSTWASCWPRRDVWVNTLRKAPDWLLPQRARLSVQNASDYCRDILIVDESNEIPSLLNNFLGKTGDQLRFCTDASEACCAIESKHPNFVISSWEMPEMNGVELCRRIRQFQRGGYLSLILIADLSYRFWRAKTGVEDFVSIPVARVELLKSVRRANRYWSSSVASRRPVVRPRSKSHADSATRQK